MLKTQIIRSFSLCPFLNTTFMTVLQPGFGFTTKRFCQKLYITTWYHNSVLGRKPLWVVLPLAIPNNWSKVIFMLCVTVFQEITIHTTVACFTHAIRHTSLLLSEMMI